MNLKTKVCFVLISLGLLVGCATVTPYRAAQHSDDYGYQEQKIEQDRYRVSFAGNSSTSRQTVENYLLFRAAELTLEQGKDYFVIVNSDTEKNTEQHATTVGAPSFTYGYGHPYGHGYRHGLGVGFTIFQTSFSDYEAFGVVVLRSGKKPADNLDAYNASEVVENLGLSVLGSELKKYSSDR